MVNWSTIDHRSLAGRLLRLPARALPRSSVMTIRRGPARGLKWIAGSANHGCWLGTYELEKQRALERFVRPGMTVYDIGAQAGFYTLFFSRLVTEAGRVYAFEPCPNETHFLVHHVRMNRLVNVRIVQAAAGARDGLVGMTVDRGRTQNQVIEAGAAALLVSSLALDAAALPVPDLIKMDVEGAESEVLGGAARILREARPVVFVALHTDEQRAKCVEILGAAGYSIHLLDGRRIDGAFRGDEIYATPARLSHRAK